MKLKVLLLICLIPFSKNLWGKQREVAVIGTGYVGLVLGACTAKFGHNTVCADVDKNKIQALNNGHIPIYEPGLKELVAQGVQDNKLHFTSDVESVINNAEVIFIAVGTPMDEDGQADLSYVKAVAKTIGKNLNGYKLICTKSTVPIGTGKIIKNIILNENPNAKFDIASNPEFLREGSAIVDFIKADRIVIGVDSQKAKELLYDIYQPLLKENVPMVVTDIVTAETIKYAANSFLATKISFINEIANLCEETGANIVKVVEGIGLDKRIGKQFLNPGPGFGGSCFPKDTQALLYAGKQHKSDLRVVEAALLANENQKKRVFKKLSKLFNNDLKGKTVGILGLAFKAETDDVRYSPAIALIEQLIKENVKVKAFDPVAAENMKKIFSNILYCGSIEEVAKNTDAIVVLTEWNQFKHLDFARLKPLVNKAIVLDTRNILDPKKLKQLGYKFENIGNADLNG